MNKQGIIRLDYSISTLITLAIFGFWFWSNNQVQVGNRDAQRLSDLRQVQAAMAELYRDYHTYTPASCQQEDPVSQCQLTDYLPAIAEFNDPGQGQYLVNIAPDENQYAIQFILEGNYQELKSGYHLLTEQGIE